MKNHLSIAFVLCLFFVNAQKSNELDKLPVDVSEKNFTEREVTHMAVFPGCKSINVNDKDALQKCMAAELRNLLAKKLDGFSDKMEAKGWTSAVTTVQFVIDVHGKIVQIKALEGGNYELAREAENAMNKIANSLKKIEPAMVENGTVVNLFFQLPVKFKVQNPQTNEFPWSEIVIATLKNEKSIYEVRENTKESNLKVYEIQKNKEFFLGNFKSFEEIISLEPYKSMILPGDKFLLAEKEVNKEIYRIYYSQTEKNQVEVYKLVNNTEEKFEFLPQLDMQYSLLYMKLVLR